MEPSGWAVDGGRPPASRTSAREERAFDSEVERAAERAGGAEAREARRAELHASHRTERRAGFGREEAAPRAPRPDREPGADAPLQLQPNAPAPPRVSDPGAGAASPSAHRETATAGPDRPGAPSSDASNVDAGANAAAPAPVMTAANGAAPSTGAVQGVAAAGRASGGSNTATAAFGDAPRGPRDAATAARTAEARPSRPAPPEPPVDDAHEILRQVRLHLAPGIREASLSLVPAHLGRLQVKLSISDGKVGAIVRAESKETLDLLERHLPELREALGREGLDAGDIQLELGLDRDHGGSRADGPARERGSHLDPPVTHAAADVRLARLLQRLSPNEGGVDTYA